MRRPPPNPLDEPEIGRPLCIASCAPIDTGAVLANFGKGVMVTPHGISLDKQGNVWIRQFVIDEASNAHRSQNAALCP
jgi:hypothetical protein